ncbi:MAG TPA: hypothetical protein V6C86_05595 [Oculatellaceae cyanobacterium]
MPKSSADGRTSAFSLFEALSLYEPNPAPDVLQVRISLHGWVPLLDQSTMVIFREFLPGNGGATPFLETMPKFVGHPSFRSDGKGKTTSDVCYLKNAVAKLTLRSVSR